MSRQWKQTRPDRWDSNDGCVVKIDHTVECSTSRPWRPHYRGWIAYGPGADEHNYLGFSKRNSMANIPRKFKTPESGMKAVDKEWPI